MLKHNIYAHVYVPGTCDNKLSYKNEQNGVKSSDNRLLTTKKKKCFIMCFTCKNARQHVYNGVQLMRVLNSAMLRV